MCFVTHFSKLIELTYITINKVANDTNDLI